jgi:tetratricopeptide (TPR) repeat protein
MGEERIILPPPIDRRRAHEILAEIPGILGAVLWQDVRHLRAWAETPEASRAALFNPDPPYWVHSKRREAMAQCGGLSEPLSAFGALVRAPRRVDVGRVAAACQAVVEWALDREYTQTAIEFAEAAALIDPENPRLANLAGRVSRNANDYGRAEVWFNRGIGFAREQQDWVELTRGHLGAGILWQEVGRIAQAMRHFNSGSRWGRKVGLEWLSAEVQHDLTVLLTVRGLHADAEKHARRALSWYPKHHERFPLFGADVGLLLVLERNYAVAARLLRRVLQVVSQPAPRSVILALLARALAGAGLVDELDRFEQRIFRILERHHDKEAVALWHLAAAERIARRWEVAESNARRALELATARGDRETARLSSHLLTAIQARRPAPPPCVARTDREFLGFMETVTSRLSQWSPDRRARSLIRTEWAA